MDDVDTFELINQTTLSITTSGKSFLSLLYAMPAVFSIVDTMTGAIQIEIALTVSGAGNRTTKVAYYRQLATPGSYSEIPADVTITYVTGELSAGTYTISVYWKSIWPSSGANSLITNNPPNFDYARSLTVEEIRT